ncbi:MAG: hypothetical protein AAGA71_20970 [Pseudomonadota bacterium]
MAYLLVYVFLAIPTGAMFLWIAFLPETLPQSFGLETVPVLVRGVSRVFGIVLTAASLAALRHGLRLQMIVRGDEPQPARVSILVEDDSDTTTYTAIVSKVGSDTTWRTPIYRNKAVERLLDGSAQTVEAWSDNGNGAPIALRVDGSIVYTYPKATRTHQTVRD